MPYRYLAESLCELQQLTILVDQLEVIKRPLRQLQDESYLVVEVHRIKLYATRDILIFGQHFKEYLRCHIIKIYSMIIRINTVLMSLPELLLMTAFERHHYRYCMNLKRALENLAIFFVDYVMYY